MPNELYNTAVDALVEAHIRIRNLEAIAQALADELMALDTLEYSGGYRKPGPRYVEDYEDWLQTRNDAKNAGNP